MIDMAYPLKIFHLLGFPSWKSSDTKIIGVNTDLFENFSQKKGFRKFQVTFLGQKNGQLYHFLGEAGKQEILQQMFRKF